MTVKVACLDVYDPIVQQVLISCKPSDWVLEMATSYNREEQESLLADADYVLAGWSPVDAWMLEAGNKLRMVQKFGIGFDKIDISTAKKKGITVAIASGMNAVPVSELVILLILGLYRRLTYLYDTLHRGEWVKSEMRATSYQIFNKKVGIIGLGNIGKAVAKLVQAFGAEVLYFDVFRLTPEEEEQLNVRFCGLHDLLQSADIVSLHIPSTVETKHMINEDTLELMKKEAILINTARGELIDENDLIKALKNNRIRGAGLDVFSVEPLPQDHPFLALDNVVLTPHIGGTVYDNAERMAKYCFQNIRLHLMGKDLSPKDLVISGNR